MRRVTLMLVALAVMVTLFAAVAYAATIDGTRKGEVLLESSENDTIFGRGGGDRIQATVFGPGGDIGETPEDRDVVYGNAGNDGIQVDDGDGRDTAIGGNGDNDVCIGDPGDQLVCEQEAVDTGNPGQD